MSRRISLVEHNRPRILTIDFSDAEATKIRNLGYNVRQGATQLLPDHQFSIPWSVQDVEIMFARVSPDSFATVAHRSPHKSSVEDEPVFLALMQDLWFRRGWVVLFVEQDCLPDDLSALGISYIGVFKINQNLYSLKEYSDLKKMYPPAQHKISDPFIPLFKGEAIRIDPGKPENEILQRYIQGAKMSVLAVDGRLTLDWARDTTVSTLITGESSANHILALKMSWGRCGSILVLPDFGKSNVDVAIGLLQNVIPADEPSLFDSPEHPWLEDYLPHPVREIKDQKDGVIALAEKKLEVLSEAEENELNSFNWLLGLLTSPGDEFRDHVATALRFIGFEVQVIDDVVPPGQALKEDLHLTDLALGFFAIAETKSTKRGAGEDFITDLQNHQGRYSREMKVPIPNGVLVVNHSTEFNPSQRTGRFYQNANVISRCKAQGITAIDSVALHQMCQSILRNEVSAERVRNYITSEHRVIATFDANELA